jgi:DNA-binding transcriptional ArsR family regulator
VTTYEATYDAVIEALADGTRRRILERLARGPAAVSEIAEAVPVSRPAVSQHLRVLLAAGLVGYDEVGTRNVYRLAPDGLVVLRSWLDEFWAGALGHFESFAIHRAAERGAP